MIQASQKQSIIFQWFYWQFFKSSAEILKAWKNFLFFNLNYFSIPLLLKTYFSHWHKYRLSYGRGFDFKVLAEAFTFNIFSRVVGAILRTVFIIAGVLLQVFILIAGLVLFVGWLALPFILAFGIFFGFSRLI